LPRNSDREIIWRRWLRSGASASFPVPLRC